MPTLSCGTPVPCPQQASSYSAPSGFGLGHPWVPLSCEAPGRPLPETRDVCLGVQSRGPNTPQASPVPLASCGATRGAGQAVI